MEYHLTKKSIRGTRRALDTCAEQAADIDLTLPDYCPDIERILSCTLDPQIYMNSVSGDRLNVEGASCVRVLYLDSERGCLRAYETSQPFSESFPLKGDVTDCAVSVQAKPEYINCRALSPRKLSLHGAFSLCARVTVPCEIESFSYEDGGDLQTKSETLSVSSLCGICSESFSVQEDLPVSAESGSGTILGRRVSARMTEVRAIRGKIMLSAEIRLEMMLPRGAEQTEAECMSFAVPVSRVIDCEGVTEDAVIDGELNVLSADVRLSDDSPDDSRLLLTDVKLCFSALCWEEQQLDVLCDAFSTDREVQLKQEPFSCRGGMVCRSFTDVGKAAVSVEEDIGRVIDVRCEKLTSSVVQNEDAVTVYTKLCAGILYENTDGEKRYAQRDAEFRYTPDTGENDEVVRLKSSLDSLSYRLTDARHIELRAELAYHMTLCRRQSCTALTAVTADDDAPERVRDDALILYYPDSGEQVWDIAKRFCSRPADIIDENNLSGDCADSGMMLLIPRA
ncbi:MAG: DUF3794 domain-containing protein [Ruminococcus sp.]|nr:DUF3794 domain-containing protein [Ruminococcus sp.]